jgi:hypothetical protein
MGVFWRRLSGEMGVWVGVVAGVAVGVALGVGKVGATPWGRGRKIFQVARKIATAARSAPAKRTGLAAILPSTGEGKGVGVDFLRGR